MPVDPFFTVVMASHLGHYTNAASRREEKFRRAVESVIDQSFDSWELIIVADGCEATQRITQKEFLQGNIHCIPIPKVPLWSTLVRNTGIEMSKGKYILYLDTDDFLGFDHLQIVHDGLMGAGSPSWAYFNDQYWNERLGCFTERICDIGRKFRHGTSNIVHGPEFRWPEDKTYLHDYRFIMDLKKSAEGKRIPSASYFVCHDIEAGKVKFDV